MIKGKNILLTGGAGFIGSHIAESLIAENSVTIFDNCSRDALSYTKLKDNKNLAFIKGDILDKEKVSKLVADFDVIIHLAAIAGVSSVVNNPAKTFKVNLIGTHNILEAIQNNGSDIDRFVDFSTSEVYGPMAENVTEKSMTVQGPISEPRWNYAVSKLASEYLTHAYHTEFGLPTVSVRPFNIYGPRQIGEGAIHNFIANAIKNNDIIINGSGEQIRAWCYVSDMVDGVLLGAEKKEAIGESFNIGNPSAAVSTKELAKTIIQITTSKSKIKFRKIDYPEIEKRIPCIDKAESVLGYKPKINLKEGISKTVEWYKEI